MSEHGNKCDVAIFCHCHTHSVINVNETAETESCIIVKYIELCMISTSTELYLNHTVLVTLTIKFLCCFFLLFFYLTTSRDNLPLACSTLFL